MIDQYQNAGEEDYMYMVITLIWDILRLFNVHNYFWVQRLVGLGG